jgi:predicted ester cyclase
MKIRRYVMARRLGVVAVVAAAAVASATPSLAVVATSVPEPAPPTSPPSVAMSIEETQAVMDAYVAALVAREDIAPYFSDDVVLELIDVDQRVQGRDEVVDAIVVMHEQTFDATPELTNLVIGEGTAAAEVVFIGTQTGDFVGIPASGKQVAVPYAVFYDLADSKITALRIHGLATGLVAALTAEATPASTAP